MSLSSQQLTNAPAILRPNRSDACAGCLRHRRNREYIGSSPNIKLGARTGSSNAPILWSCLPSHLGLSIVTVCAALFHAGDADCRCCRSRLGRAIPGLGGAKLMRVFATPQTFVAVGDWGRNRSNFSSGPCQLHMPRMVVYEGNAIGGLLTRKIALSRGQSSLPTPSRKPSRPSLWRRTRWATCTPRVFRTAAGSCLHLPRRKRPRPACETRLWLPRLLPDRHQCLQQDAVQRVRQALSWQGAVHGRQRLIGPLSRGETLCGARERSRSLRKEDVIGRSITQGLAERPGGSREMIPIQPAQRMNMYTAHAKNSILREACRQSIQQRRRPQRSWPVIDNVVHTQMGCMR